MFQKDGPSTIELLKQSLSSTQEGYNLLASKFDNTPFRSDRLVLTEITQQIKKYAPYNLALDVCCGTGAGIETIYPFIKQSITGVDYSREMLKQAQKNLRQKISKNYPNIKLIQKDIFKLNIKNKFDLAVCFGAYGHIDKKNQKKFLDNINNALKSGGYFIFNLTDDLPWYCPKFIILKGFDIVMKIRNFLIKPEFIMYYMDFTASRLKTIIKSDLKWKLIDIIKLKKSGSIYNPSDCLVVLKKVNNDEKS